MTVQIAGFVTRAAAGLVAPKSFSRNITPDKGGVAPHYGGPAQPAAAPGSDHAICVSTWRNWQKFHMVSNGWADIAYTGGFCNHGYAFAGRGAGIRTAANGTNAGNQNFYAVVWIGGEGQTPTQEAYDAADWWINELRQNGRAGRLVKPHRFFKSTGCPGEPFVAYATSRDGKDIALLSAPAPKPPAVIAGGVSVKRLQAAVRTTADGQWGPTTEKHMNAVRHAHAYHGTRYEPDVKFVQGVVGTKQDGIWGPASATALKATTSALQQALRAAGFDPTGTGGNWGPYSESAYQAARAKFHR